MKEHKLLASYQWGFRPNHNISTTLLKVADDIREVHFIRLYHGIWLWTLTYSFKKWEFISRRKLKTWFDTYMHDREQCVISQNRFSSLRYIRSAIGISTATNVVHSLYHGCAIVAHCVTARWRNFSYYCPPPRQYDVWVTCSEHRGALTRRADSTRCTQASAYSARTKYIVRQWTSMEGSLRHSSGWGTEALLPL